MRLALDPNWYLFPNNSKVLPTIYVMTRILLIPNWYNKSFTYLQILKSHEG